MGDRTQVDFDFANDHALRLAAEEFGEPGMWTEPWSGQWPGVNYGGLEERERIARAGGVFIGTHQEGGEYGPMRFVGFEGELHEHECDIGYWLTIGLPDDDWAEGPELWRRVRRVLKYHATERRAAEYLRKTSVYVFETGEFKNAAEAVAEWPGDEPLEFPPSE